MFKHIFINRIKCFIREKTLVFWTLLFPIILGTLFSMAFSNITSAEKFKEIDVAVINDEHYENNIGFKNLIEELSSDEILNVKYLDQSSAEEMLLKNKIAGYIYIDEKPKLVVSKNGLDQSILKSILDNYLEITSAIESIVLLNPEVLSEIIDDVKDNINYTKNITNSDANYTVIYFYSLIGMACLFASFWGLKIINESQANLSDKGMRLSVSPVHKLKVIVYSLLSGLALHFLITIIVLLYLTFVLSVDFASQFGYILLLCLFGSLAGITFGALIGSIPVKKENLKVGIVVMASNFLSFLSGLMYAPMKYIISEKLPLLAKINPVSLITDSLYMLYYYQDSIGYFINIVCLFVFSVTMIAITYLIVRGQKYASL